MKRALTNKNTEKRSTVVVFPNCIFNSPPGHVTDSKLMVLSEFSFTWKSALKSQSPWDRQERRRERMREGERKRERMRQRVNSRSENTFSYLSYDSEVCHSDPISLTFTTLQCNNAHSTVYPDKECCKKKREQDRLLKHEKEIHNSWASHNGCKK